MLQKAAKFISAFMIAWGLLNAQSRAPRQIDIGAAQAPLTDAEREDLSKAVAAHNYAAEKAVVDKASAENPNSAEVQVVAGRLAFLEKQPKDAVEAFSRAAKIKPLNEADRLSLAIVLEAVGKRVEARQAIVALTKDFPNNAKYQFMLGRFDSDTRHVDEAIADLKQAIRIDPGFLKAYQELGRMQETAGLEDDARATYAAAVERNRKDHGNWEWPPIDLAALQLKSGQFDEAEKLLREALVYNPRSGWAHYYLGQLAQKRDQRQAAIAEYTAAVAQVPALRQAWLALGREYTRAGQKEEAERCLAIFKKLEDEENLRKGAPEKDAAPATPKQSPSTGSSRN